MKSVLVFLALCFSFMLSAQTPEEQAAAYMNNQDWFGLQRVYNAKKDSLSPFLRHFARALLANSFNRPQEACEATRLLLEQYQENMGFENTASMLLLLAGNQSKLGNNVDAAATIKEFCDQLEGQVDSAFLSYYRLKEKEYQILGAYELYKMERVRGNITIPIQLDSIGKYNTLTIHLPGKLNGQEAQMTLDTGAGVNVVTPEMAKKYGMKVLDVDIRAHGIQQGNGSIAIAENMQIGELTVRNVPFYVLDFMTGVEEADKHLANLKVIVGLPLLNKLGEIGLDFNNHQLVVSSGSTPGNIESNICFNAQEILVLEAQEIKEKENLHLLLDSGSGLSNLNYSYYEKHRENIERIGSRDTMRIAGFGGTTKVDIYKIPDFGISIREQKVLIPTIDVVCTPGSEALHFSHDGILGMDFFANSRYVTINLENMYVTCE